MDFPFDLKEIFPAEISVVNSQLLTSRPSDRNGSKLKINIGHVIDVIGEASANAQKLSKPITTKEKFASSSNKIYIKRVATKVVGFLKIGNKNLFLFDLDGNYHEVQPLCILDFYVHESMQRQGSGKQLFDFMLQHENVKPYQLAINRPSAKFLSFLDKHYDLKSKIPQINNFVVFHNFFQGRQATKNRRIWSYVEDDSWFSRMNGDALRQPRPVSLEGRIKLPTLDATRSHSKGDSSPLATKSNDRQSKPAGHREFQDGRGKYFSTEVVAVDDFKGVRSYGAHASSACSHRRQKGDTSWNIFGVSSPASRHDSNKDDRSDDCNSGSRISSCANRAKSSSLLSWCNE